jgi:uncharacterized membrane protein YeaQ/YmgE (transglycosylase-associated protein family)
MDETSLILILIVLILTVGAFGGLVSWLLACDVWSARTLFIDIILGIAGAVLSTSILSPIMRACKNDPLGLLEVASYLLASAIVARHVIKRIPKRLF